MNKQEQPGGNVLWPKQCTHIFDKSLGPFATLRVHTHHKPESGLHSFDDTVVLCAFCSGLVLAGVKKSLDEPGGR